MVLRSLLVSLFLWVAAGAMPQDAAPSGIPQESAQAADFKEASRLLAAGSLDQAVVLTKQGLTQSPHSLVGLNLLGVIYQQQGKYQEAVAQFQQALTIAPNSVDTLVNLGTSLAGQNKNDLAEKSLKKALRLQPGNKTAIYNLGIVLLSEKRPKESLSYLQRMPAPDQSARLLVIRAYLDAGMPADGMAASEKLSKAFPKDTRIHFSLGVLLASHRQYRQAAYEFEKADALEPGNFDILHDLGHAYVVSGQLAKAQETFNQALRLQPDSADTLYLLAETAAGMHKEVDALELLVRARKIAPSNTNILFLMAQLSMKQSFFEDAIEVLNDGLRIDPQRADFHAALGESYFTIGKVDKALEEFRTLISLDPSPPSYVFMGLCYRHLGKYDEAKGYLKRSLAADPNNVPALFNLGFIARKECDYPQRRTTFTSEQQNEADLRELEAEVKQHPDRPRSLYLLAESLLKLGRTNDAMQVLQRLDAVSGGDFRTKLNTGVLLGRFHLYPDAIRYFEAALKISSSSDDAKYNLAEAYFQSGNYEDALKSLLEVSPDGQKEGSYLGLLGDVYARLNRYEDASKCLEQALSVTPDNDQYYVSLALVQLRAGATENADRVARRGLARIPNSGLLYWTAGIVAVSRGHERDAENLLKKASELSPSRETVAATLGIFYYEVGRYSDAREILRRCEEMFPHGTLDFQKINAVLDAASSSGAPRPSDNIPPDARKEFYELALMMRDEEQ